MALAELMVSIGVASLVLTFMAAVFVTSSRSFVEMGNYLDMDRTSRNVEGLLRRGYVERREDERDRRMKRLRITAAGRGVVRAVNTARLQGLETWAATLTDAQREQLAAALVPITEGLPG